MTAATTVSCRSAAIPMTTHLICGISTLKPPLQERLVLAAVLWRSAGARQSPIDTASALVIRASGRTEILRGSIRHDSPVGARSSLGS